MIPHHLRVVCWWICLPAYAIVFSLWVPSWSTGFLSGVVATLSVLDFTRWVIGTYKSSPRAHRR